MAARVIPSADTYDTKVVLLQKVNERNQKLLIFPNRTQVSKLQRLINITFLAYFVYLLQQKEQ